MMRNSGTPLNMQYMEFSATPLVAALRRPAFSQAGSQRNTAGHENLNAPGRAQVRKYMLDLILFP